MNFYGMIDYTCNRSGSIKLLAIVCNIFLLAAIRKNYNLEIRYFY